MSANLVGIETHVTRWRIFAKLQHEFECSHTFGTVHSWLAADVKHLSAKSPEYRHEVGHCCVALCGAHHVTVSFLPTLSFFLLDSSGGSDHVVPGCWFLQ